jgi:hypothetical protein
MYNVGWQLYSCCTTTTSTSASARLLANDYAETSPSHHILSSASDHFLS